MYLKVLSLNDPKLFVLPIIRFILNLILLVLLAIYINDSHIILIKHNIDYSIIYSRPSVLLR